MTPQEVQHTMSKNEKKSLDKKAATELKQAEYAVGYVLRTYDLPQALKAALEQVETVLRSSSDLVKRAVVA